MFSLVSWFSMFEMKTVLYIINTITMLYSRGEHDDTNL